MAVNTRLREVGNGNRNRFRALCLSLCLSAHNRLPTRVVQFRQSLARRSADKAFRVVSTAGPIVFRD